MSVIADLHGGDPDDPVAVAEFRDIKDKVQLEVSVSLSMAGFAADQLKP